MGATGQTITKVLENKRRKGQKGMIIIRAEQVRHSEHTVDLTLNVTGLKTSISSCCGLVKKPGYCLYEIHRATDSSGDHFARCYTSEITAESNKNKGGTNITFKKLC